MIDLRNLLAAGVAAFALAAASSASAQTKTLYVGMNGGNFERVFTQAVFPAFEKENNVKIVVVPGTSADILAKVDKLEAVCRRFDVPLPAAAIQYPLRHPASTVVVIGAKTAAQVKGNVEWFERDIPEELWTTLEAEGLIPAI